MIKAILFLLTAAFCTTVSAAPEQSEYCSGWPALLKHPCKRLKQTWYEGDLNLIITGYAWHNRYTYRPEKIKTYNELAIGGGLGKTFIDENGNMHGLFAAGFSDSHRRLEPAVGYAFTKNWPLAKTMHFGLGFSALVTARRDINKGIPFPGVIPILSLQVQRATVFATYIPGAAGAGNVLFIFGKWQLTNV